MRRILGHRAPFFRRGSFFALNIFVYVLPQQRRSGIYTTGYLRRPQQENELFPSFLMYDGRFADKKRFRARFCPPAALGQCLLSSGNVPENALPDSPRKSPAGKQKATDLRTPRLEKIFLLGERHFPKRRRGAKKKRRGGETSFAPLFPICF